MNYTKKVLNRGRIDHFSIKNSQTTKNVSRRNVHL